MNSDDPREMLQQLLDEAMDNGHLSDEQYEAMEAYLNGEDDNGHTQASMP